MIEHIVFYDFLDQDGWGEVTSMHRSPHRLGADALAIGVTVQVPTKPVRTGWITKPWVNPADGSFEWRMTRDPDYRVSISEFLSSFPPMARVNARARRDTDPVIGDFMDLLDMAVKEGRGVNPHGPTARAGLAYLVSIDLMSQAEADAITDAAND